MKRKAENQTGKSREIKRKAKPSISPEEAKERFRAGLFDEKALNSYVSEYKESSPYKHCVIHGLINDQLLRDVRDETKENVNFTPKETDIYKIHQSGDLANLDGLDDESLTKLPSLVKLRDALYSQTFRDYVSSITGCGALSGRKRDLAINIYTPGGFLLCHDDVIGTRKVSYILYLVDPDIPWKPEWGGALRLYPVRELTGKDGVVARTPRPDHCKSIPPTWNQLSFFEVQPGESFHDVEEVYHPESDEDLEKDGGRVRMAISGWFHIPQFGEDGYVEGAAEALEKNSGLAQLQGNPDQYDLPQPNVVPAKPLEDEFTEEDLSYLVKYMNPQYLVPDTVEGMVAFFEDASTLTLENFLNDKFVEKIKEYITKHEESVASKTAEEIEKGAWKIAQPPHKHRYLYLQAGNDAPTEQSPLQELIEEVIPSDQFQKWLESITRSKVLNRDLLVRRFRRGMDYTLATGYEGNPRLELNLCLTPTPGWGADAEHDDEDEEEEGPKAKASETNGEANAERNGSESKPTNGSRANGNREANNGNSKEEAEVDDDHKSESDSDGDDSNELDVGGQEIYMAGDDNDEEEDAAVYKTSTDDDNILFFQTASWNTLTLVLRDGGALKFTKYVSRAAKGDRWDISGSFDVEMEEDDKDDEEEEEEGPRGVQDDSEEEFEGFSDHEDTNSDSD